MNAPVASAALAAPLHTYVALDAITPSKTHIQELRRGRFDKKLLEELSTSIRQVGVLQPIVLRPLGGGRHEIVAGERRWLAAKLAGLSNISASVADLNDEQVLEVQLIENLQREGLHELEEAEGYEELMKLKKISADVVADMVGRSRSYVFKRTKLLALCKEARQAFYGGALDASRALLIARIGHHDTQREALKFITKGRHPNDGPMSFRDAQKFILDHYMLRLQQAPFDIKDEQLVAKAGSCVKCPKRTGNQSDLFGDVKDADTCTDPKCYDDKRTAHMMAEVARLEAAGKKVIHGAAAKKIFREWNSDNKWLLDRMEGGYRPMTDDIYVGYNSIKVSKLVGDEYEPILIQHPGTGHIVKVADPEAIASASRKLSRAKNKGKSKSSNAGAAQAKKDDGSRSLIAAQVIKTGFDKAPTELGTIELRLVAAFLWAEVVNACSHDAQAHIAAAVGWKLKPSWSDRAPKDLAKLSGKDLARFILTCCLAVDREQSISSGIAKSLKVDEKAIEKQVRAELKKKADEAKAAEKAKAKPAAKAKKK
jgi:ParB/RepB/Spo0J family partition protein